MLPASFQTPAAVVLVIGGLLSCFAGYRVFRFVLGFFGFVLGALLASSLIGTEQGLWMVAAAIVGGIVGALILVGAYFVGVALIGAAFGALGVAHPLWAAFGREPHILVVIAFAVAGALAAMALQRYVIIVTTSYGGAWTAIVGGLTLMGDRLAIEATARNNVWLAYPLNPAPGQRWVIAVFLLLGTAGLIIQLTITAGKDKKR
jgi:hypothetical protein